MKKDRVLIVEEDLKLQRLLQVQLLARDFEVRVTDRGEDALLTAAEFEPDMILLGLALPGINGVETTRRLREWTQTPIIILNDQDAHPPAVESRDTDAVEALDSGADDYLITPFHIAELLARMRAVRRRAQGGAATPALPTSLTFGSLSLDLLNRRVAVDGHTLHLTPTEYDLLRVLASYAGRVLTHREILTRVWGPEASEDTPYVHVFVSQLRRKLGCGSAPDRHIETEPGVGYRFCARD